MLIQRRKPAIACALLAALMAHAPSLIAAPPDEQADAASQSDHGALVEDLASELWRMETYDDDALTGIGVTLESAPERLTVARTCARALVDLQIQIGANPQSLVTNFRETRSVNHLIDLIDQRIAQAPPNLVELHWLRAKTADLGFNDTAATDSINAILALDPNNAEAALWLGVFDLSEGRPAEARARFEALLNRPSIEEFFRARLLNNIGLSFALEDDFKGAEGYYVDAETIMFGLALPANESSTAVNLGFVSEQRGDYESALEYYEKALWLNQSCENLMDQIGDFLSLAAIHTARGDRRMAFRMCSNALSICMELRLPVSEIITLFQSADLLRANHEYERATEVLERALQSAELIGLEAAAADARLRLADLRLENGEVENAIEILNQAMAVFEKQENTAKVASARYLLGYAAYIQGDVQGALESLLKAKALHEKLGDRANLTRDDLALGRVHEALGDAEAAERHYVGAIEMLRELNAREDLAAAYRRLSIFYDECGRLTDAIDMARRARDQYEDLADVYSLAIMSITLSMLLSDDEQFERAEVQAHKALALFEVEGQRVDVAIAHAQLGDLKSWQVDYSGACTHWLQALAIYEEIGHDDGASAMRLAIKSLPANACP